MITFSHNPLYSISTLLQSFSKDLLANNERDVEKVLKDLKKYNSVLQNLVKELSNIKKTTVQMHGSYSFSFTSLASQLNVLARQCLAYNVAEIEKLLEDVHKTIEGINKLSEKLHGERLLQNYEDTH